MKIVIHGEPQNDVLRLRLRAYPDFNSVALEIVDEQGNCCGALCEVQGEDGVLQLKLWRGVRARFGISVVDL